MGISGRHPVSSVSFAASPIIAVVGSPGPGELRISVDLGRHRTEPQHRVEDLAHADAAPRSDVVDIPGDTVRSGEPVGTDHVAHVGEVTARVEVACPNDRLLGTALDPDHLARQGRHDEPGLLAGTDVVEGADADDIDSGRRAKVHECRLGGGLRRAIDGGRANRRALVDRRLTRWHGIHVRAPDVEQADRAIQARGGGQRVERAVDRDADREIQVVAGAGAAHAGQEVDDVRLRRGDDAMDAVGVADVQPMGLQVARQGLVAVPRTDSGGDLVARLQQVTEQPATGEAVGADDQGAHAGQVGDRTGRPWATRARSASTIIATSSSNPTVGSQPISARAFDGFPRRNGTSDGRKYFGSTRTWSW